MQGRVPSPEALGEIVVRQADDHPIRVADVARVEDGEEEAETGRLRDGKPTVLLTVRKQSGENTVAVVDAVRERLDDDRDDAAAPATRSRSSATTRASCAPRSTRSRSTWCWARSSRRWSCCSSWATCARAVIAALAIPISIVGTFALMWIEGFTLNIITLLALALAVGIVIDDAIVVLENIFRFIDEKGVRPFPAAIVATKDIGLAVLATTLSLLAVFMPVAFMSGIVGKLPAGFGLTMAFAIAVSLLVSFTLTPMLARRAGSTAALDDKGKRLPKAKSVLERFVDAFYQPVERAYMVIAALGRWRTAGWSCSPCIAALAAMVPLFKAVPKGFLPEERRGAVPDQRARARGHEPAGDASWSPSASRARCASALPTCSCTLVTIGDEQQRLANMAKHLRAADRSARRARRRRSRFMARVRKEIVAQARPRSCASTSPRSTPSTAASRRPRCSTASPGRTSASSPQYSSSIVAELKKVPGAVDVDTNLVLGKPELQRLHRPREGRRPGRAGGRHRHTLQLLVGGLKVSTYAESGEDYDVRVRADLAYRTDRESLALITVPSAATARCRCGTW